MTVIPSHLPDDLPIGIVHLGLGAFHRAHQAVYTEEAVAKAGGAWGICGVAMHNADLVRCLEKQSGRYSLIEQHPTGPVLHQMSVIREVLCLAESPDAVAARLADPGVLVVTVTVTEKGYCFSGADRHLNRADAGIVHDLVNPQQPRTLPGILVAGLQRRRSAGGSGLSILSCDNLPGNGRLLRRLVLDFAADVDIALQAWIAEQCCFPDSMVDRITPAATEQTRAKVRTLLGRDDPVAIETEPFRQWVIEDSFAAARPAWEQAGALFVSDVAPYEAMKLRMLNGAHSLIAYLGAVAGMPAVRDVMKASDCRQLIARHMTLASETLQQVDAERSASYREALLTRFENPAIDHRCLQIAMDGSQKLPQRIFTPAEIRLARRESVDTFALATALWFRYLGGRDESGQVIECRDPLASELQSTVHAAGSTAERVAALGRLPGIANELFEREGWVSEVSALVEALEAHGVLATVSRLAVLSVK